MNPGQAPNTPGYPLPQGLQLSSLPLPPASPPRQQHASEFVRPYSPGDHHWVQERLRALEGTGVPLEAWGDFGSWRPLDHGLYYGPSRQVVISGSPVGLRTALRGVFAAPGSPRTGEQFVHSPSQAPPGWRRPPTALFRTDQDGVAHFDGFINGLGSQDDIAAAHIQVEQQLLLVHRDLNVVGVRQRQLNEALQRARTTPTKGGEAGPRGTPPDCSGPAY
mmetsp:Transcript_18348/g.45020  ORF Transcript_18348/g.45020 Transcript_18348/m.45020 type:complete len:220 (+) Transcript_18348:4332-4991(+)